MKNILIIFSLVAQLSFFPWAEAQQPSPNKVKAIKIETIKDLETETLKLLETAQEEGWQFLDQDRTPLGASNFLPELKRWLHTDDEITSFYAISPGLDEMGQFEFGFQLPKSQFNQRSTEALQFRYNLSIQSKSNVKIKSSRAVTLDLDESKVEENTLAMKRTMASMKSEIYIKAQKHLKPNSKSLDTAFDTFLNFLIPSAVAQNQNNRPSRQPVSTVSTVLDIGILVIGILATVAMTLTLTPAFGTNLNHGSPWKSLGRLFVTFAALVGFLMVTQYFWFQDYSKVPPKDSNEKKNK